LILILSDSKLRFLDNGADYFFWVSWALGFAYASLGSRLNYPIVGAFFVPLISLFMASSSFMLHRDAFSLLNSPPVSNGEEYLFALIHAVPAAIAVASLAIALLTSGIYLILEKRIRRKGQAALSLPGPNLSFLDKVSKRSILFAFMAISLVVLTGSIWSVAEGRGIITLDLSTMLGLTVWLLLALIIHFRSNLGWSARKVSRLTLLVTAFFFISVFVIAFMTGKLSHGGTLV